ncbi:L-tyrosine/L-tryptophan isonitrile synthase family protein [Streptomyces sp. AV19]|uniref:L-tyrosine/L-tryptophan isonitrile synthase family protein n=1 Tax=Streptomyces sp. AV19 TaxID=2793068 RepID=UPI0018FEDE44|nr:L-tyrosine/L-tryptophan isonitrile synthase family protein [Streptomyces sp. AV19]MBH1933881.1 L-tyrosine/L-tryptophan isonitrile synthase family protein [Streptomyces sp. AV19]MDG4535631.1 L-tyrosine/L-tryptophan isonitrile synthase family protein [Streptomyces sp. AV19]
MSTAATHEITRDDATDPSGPNGRIPEFRLIGRGHRAVEQAGRPDARLYSATEFLDRAERISPAFWQDTVLPLLRRSASEQVASRLTAAARRARANSRLYGVRTPGSAEVATEALFDGHLVRPREEFRSRAGVHRQLQLLRQSRARLRLGLPLFSRKPVSPVKNRGPYPDLADIASLLRCYELAAVLSRSYDEEVEFLVFADGVKYRRACGTGLPRVRDYQEALRFWCEQLGIGGLVKVVDYEEAVRSALGGEATDRREERYRAYCALLRSGHDGLFDPRDPAGSLAAVRQASAEGEQLDFTFRSIASSVHYRAEDLGARLARHEDEASHRYLRYLAGLLESGPSADALHAELRAEAWQAAIRYVAISLTDRELDVWSVINPAGVKLTTHGKPGEIEIRPTRSRYLSMTAQHCTGGIKRTPTGNKVTYSYRLEYESRGDVPLLLDPPAGDRAAGPLPAPLRGMLEAQQPICYLTPDDGPAWETLGECIVDF